MGTIKNYPTFNYYTEKMITKYKSAFAYILTQHIEDTSEQEILALIQLAPSNRAGDLAFPCFQLAKKLHKSPAAIAQQFANEITEKSGFSSFEAVGPYLNAHIDTSHIAQATIQQILANKSSYGRWSSNHETVLIESPGPNTNKPLHLGHIRNMLLGNSLANLLEFGWFNVKKVDIVNDRGIHICKSMLAYQLRGENTQPDKKSDHFVGDRYVKYSIEKDKNPALEEQIQEMLVKWENGDKQVRDLWNTMRQWSIDGMQQTYSRYGTYIEKAYCESDHYLTGKNLIIKKEEEWVFTKDEKGNIIYDFENDTYGKKVLLRHDGTSIYITQDIALGKVRYDDYQMDRMIYVVWNEQEYHFQVLFELFKILGYDFADKCHHLSYGMIELPDGKMKSREWKVVDADTLADELHQQAKDIILQRNPEEDDVSAKAESIAMAAIKFYVLFFDAKNNFVFDPKKSISFEGETGPYIQYTHARCCSILKKHTPKSTLAKRDFTWLQTEEEKALLIHLASFPETVQKAVDDYKPSLIARYTIDLATLFNKYYHHHKIILEDDDILTDARYGLTQSVQHILKTGLAICGIVAPQKM